MHTNARASTHTYKMHVSVSQNFFPALFFTASPPNSFIRLCFTASERIEGGPALRFRSATRLFALEVQPGASHLEREPRENTSATRLFALSSCVGCAFGVGVCVGVLKMSM